MSNPTGEPKKARYRFTRMDMFMTLVGVTGVGLFILSAVNLTSAWLELPMEERPYGIQVSVEYDIEE